MKKHILFAMMLAMSLSAVAQQKISIFCDHIETIAQQNLLLPMPLSFLMEGT